MVVLENDAFLTELTRLFQRSKGSGTVYVTMKKYDGRDRPKPRQSGKQMETGEHLCLIRATSGNRKISTVVSPRDVNRFQLAYANLLKANIDGLRKREKKGKKSETSRSSSSRKATH